MNAVMFTSMKTVKPLKVAVIALRCVINVVGLLVMDRADELD